MEKQFVTYEISLKLKELGFNEISRFGQETSLYTKEGEHIFYLNYGFMGSGLSGDYIYAPLWQQVIDWFREKHNMSIWYRQVDNDWKKLLLKQAEKINDNFNIDSFKYEFDILKDGEYIYSGMYSTYKEAREQAILRAIELIKDK